MPHLKSKAGKWWASGHHTRYIWKRKLANKLGSRAKYPDEVDAFYTTILIRGLLFGVAAIHIYSLTLDLLGSTDYWYQRSGALIVLSAAVYEVANMSANQEAFEKSLASSLSGIVNSRFASLKAYGIGQQEAAFKKKSKRISRWARGCLLYTSDAADE